MRERFLWVEGPHKIAIMPRPEGGEALDADIAELHALGVDVLVSLLERDEAEYLGLAEEAATCAKHNIEFLNFPIRDHSTPSSKEDTLAFAEKLAERLSSGKRIVLHCYAGIGRSATVAIIAMKLAGLELEDAVDRLSEARGFRVPETAEQLQWIASLPYA